MNSRRAEVAEWQTQRIQNSPVSQTHGHGRTKEASRDDGNPCPSEVLPRNAAASFDDDLEPLTEHPGSGVDDGSVLK